MKRFSAFLLALLVGFSAITSTAGPFGYHFPLYQASGVITPPAPPATNLAHHYKLNTGLTQSGGFASAWADQVGTGHLLQATGAKQPAVQGDGSLVTDGVDDFMQAVFTLPQSFTRISLVKILTHSNDTYVFDGGTADSTVLIVENDGGGIGLQAYAGSRSAKAAQTSTAWIVVTEVYAGASSVLRVNGVEITGDYGANAAGGLALGSVAGGTRNFSNSQYGEILLYDTALDATNIGLAEAYMLTVPVTP